MKARLEFNLPDERDEFIAAIHAHTTKSDIEDLRNHVRARLKHGPEPDRQFLEEVYSQILEITPYA